jgi:hypothetical protein
MITALFRDPAQARQGLQALMEMGVAQNRIIAVGSEDAREISSISGFRSLSARDDSLAALHDLNLPAADQRLFEQGLRRGHTLIAARIDRDDLDEAVRVLSMFDPVDLDGTSREWLEENPTGGQGADVGAPLGAGITGGGTAGTTNTGSLPGMGQMTEGSDALGSGDIRAGDTAQPGRDFSNTTPTGGRRSDERADREGVTELAVGSRPPLGEQALMQRHLNRGGRIWVFGDAGSGA